MKRETALRAYGFTRIQLTDYRDYPHQLWVRSGFQLRDYGRKNKVGCRYLLRPSDLPAERALRGWASNNLMYLLVNNCSAAQNTGEKAC